MRTQHIGHLTDYRRDPKTDCSCVVCNRDIKGEPKFWIHYIDDGPVVLHPADEHLYKSDGGEMGFWPVGPECAKRIGMEWIHTNKAGA
jgi:hypothetical protein